MQSLGFNLQPSSPLRCKPILSIHGTDDPSSAGKIKRLVLTDQGRTKLNLHPDRQFYSYPRFVNHVDSRFISTLTELYRERLRPGSVVLDLMSSWVSHLPEEIKYEKVVGHGLNAQELARNPRLDYFFVKDLNQEQKLALSDKSFDAVVCCVGVQYLQRPEKVFEEVYRVLRRGGVFIVSFSSRMFYEKAIREWREGNEYSRQQLVLHVSMTYQEQDSKPSQFTRTRSSYDNGTRPQKEDALQNKDAWTLRSETPHTHNIASRHTQDISTLRSETPDFRDTKRTRLESPQHAARLESPQHHVFGTPRTRDANTTRLESSLQTTRLETSCHNDLGTLRPRDAEAPCLESSSQTVQMSQHGGLESLRSRDARTLCLGSSQHQRPGTPQLQHMERKDICNRIFTNSQANSKRLSDILTKCQSIF